MVHQGRGGVCAGARLLLVFAVASCASGAPGRTGGHEGCASSGSACSHRLSGGRGSTDSGALRRRPPPLPRGRDIAQLSDNQCRKLVKQHRLPIEVIPRKRTPAVRSPMRLRGPLGGVEVAHRGRSPVAAILDCRLVVALAVWSETLRAARIKRLVHFSIFRPLAKVAGTNKRSGHARGLAIDVGQFVRDDGEVLDVEKVWTKRRRGARPCRPIGEENVNQSTLRGLVCSAARQKLFQVILTPHHDRAHRTHVHLELRPRVDWDYIR